MIKKVAKTLEEITKNEELMAQILGEEEEGEGITAAEGQVDFEGTGTQNKKQLMTIGKDGDE